MVLEVAQDFASFQENIWLNAAYQGPMPRVAADAAHHAVEACMHPYRLDSSDFETVPQQLKSALGRLLHVPPFEIILGNSASYGLHLLANGIPWKFGQEIIVVQDDFPANILPWLALRQQGILVRQEPAEQVVHPDSLTTLLRNSTKLLCVSWVNSFTGSAVDVHALAEVCQQHGVLFVLNGAQALGTLPLDLTQTPVDAVVGVGHKWLCGPYGTGFCWLRPALQEMLQYNQAYWQVIAADLDGPAPSFPFPNQRGSERYDVFSTANFLNFRPWVAALEYFLNLSIDSIAQHNRCLVHRLIQGLDLEKYRVMSPTQGPEQSMIVILSHVAPEQNREIHQRLHQHHIHTALRRGNLRLSPHLYNTETDIDRVLEILNTFPA